MLIDKRNKDDESHSSVASGHTWSQGSGQQQHPREDEDDAFSQSVLSAPGCLNRGCEAGIEGLDSHEYPPFAPALPMADNNGFPAPAAVPLVVEVDAETRTIRVEMENAEGDQNNSGIGAQSSTNTNHSNDNPMARLSRYQRCWLIVFVRKWVRCTGAYTRAAARKYSPKVKQAAGRSAVVVKKASIRSASFVRTQSVKCKNRAVEFSEKHQVRDKARTSVKELGKGVQNASKATVKGVKKASVATARGIKDLEEKHHIMTKSKRGLKKGGRMIRNAWNGKPLDAGPCNSSSCRTAGGSGSSFAAPTGPIVVGTQVDGGGSPKVPPPSSE